MKYAERDQLVADLRAMADFVEENGHKLPSLYIGNLSASVEEGEWKSVDGKYQLVRNEPATKDKMREYALVLKPCEKDYSGNSFTLRKRFDKHSIAISTTRENVCVMVKTGEVIEHEEYTIPARTEEVVEWVCSDPLLASSK